LSSKLQHVELVADKAASRAAPIGCIGLMRIGGLGNICPPLGIIDPRWNPLPYASA
jgi:hypothetical protein